MLQGFTSCQDHLERRSDRKSEQCTSLKLLNLHTVASLDDPGCILAKLQPHINEYLRGARITFRVSEENVQYVGSILATDFHKATPKTPGDLKEKAWSAFLSRGDCSGLFIVICFWRKKKHSVRPTFEQLSDKIAATGIQDISGRPFPGNGCRCGYGTDAGQYSHNCEHGLAW